MAEYKVLEKSFINDTLVNAGDFINLPDDIEPGANLELVEDPDIARPARRGRPPEAATE